MNASFLNPFFERRPVAGQATEPEFAIEQQTDRLVIAWGGQPVATYVFADSSLTRPYFAHVHAPGGQQPNHPKNPIWQLHIPTMLSDGELGVEGGLKPGDESAEPSSPTAQCT